MSEPQRIDPRHSGTRKLLRLLGPVLALAGVGLIVIGVSKLIREQDTESVPIFMFTGMPLLALGLGMCLFGFMGALARYQAQEMAPVARDTFNVVAEGTRPGVRQIAEALGEGLAAARPGTPASGPGCPQCGRSNAPGAQFCDQCGAPLGGRGGRACPACQAANAADARFCARCGAGLN